uniref:Reverse transcriptase zinc-binding domain-containing protein n=1 Tax=Fagus sylvatica TaxID=28930 RepID=A0A2N9INQ2_FAGSY
MATRDDIVDFFGTSPTTKFEKYLGLPPVIGRAKKKAFQEIKDRVWKKLQGWKEKLLSQAGREVLLKVVIQAIPTYAMSVFKFPAGLCEEISAMANSFWWGQRRAGRKIHWLNKKELVRAKSDGVGFLRSGLRWHVGVGSHINIWQDSWLSVSPSFKVITTAPVLPGIASVESLIDAESMTWKKSLIEQIFLPRDSELILKIPLSPRRPPDKLIWSGSNKGQYTVKSGYQLLLSQQRSHEAPASSSLNGGSKFWNAIWAVWVAPKVRLFIWRACRDILPTQTKLFDRNISHSFTCLWCGEEPETCDHVLWCCEFVQHVWREYAASIPVDFEVDMTFRDFIDRNEMFWDGKIVGVLEICQRAVGYAIDFMEAGEQLLSKCAGSDVPIVQSWKAPVQGRYKMNLAVSFRPAEKLLGVGVLIRDCQGLVMAAFCTCSTACGDVLQDQARAVMFGVHHALEIGILQVEVESCFQELTGLINAGPPCLAANGVLVDDICSFFSSVSIC